MDHADINRRFGNSSADSRTREIVSRCLEVAQYINRSVLDGREKSLAITHLEETMFWGCAALDRQNTDA